MLTTNAESVLPQKKEKKRKKRDTDRSGEFVSHTLNVELLAINNFKDTIHSRFSIITNQAHSWLIAHGLRRGGGEK